VKDSLFDLSGRVALVTGGSKGLGKAMAHELALAGADIVISSRHEDELKAALEEILAGTPVRGAYCVADMTCRQDVDRLAKSSLAEMGKVDILINNAGYNTPEFLDGMGFENWDRTVELNLTSCIALTAALIPQMKERQWGRVINISSIMALGGKEGRSSYAATKAALIGMTRVHALELGPYGITVNCLCPGPFLTDLPKSVLNQEQLDSFAQQTAVGRWGDPRELAGPALLMASEAGSFITGTALTVDGGVMCRTF
jgi:NAD(P)-dependent dehydrogenase (short-subunit alcohol dehydrogenase family)